MQSQIDRKSKAVTAQIVVKCLSLFGRDISIIFGLKPKHSTITNKHYIS